MSPSLKTTLKIRASMTFAVLVWSYILGKAFDTHNFEIYAAGLVCTIVALSAVDIYVDRKKRSTR